MSTAAGPELWGGIECTVNRVRDETIDQLAQSGHAYRDDDLVRMAALGIRTWRYPVLWERVAPGKLRDADWSWPDRRLGGMRELGLEPIAGLVHHGSGPRDTHLLDPAFPERLAAYAGAVAERYPWIRRWTPVNEPLSTARFSGLDGHWYPHARSPKTFARALLHECRGTALAMAAIRRVNPAAELVFTEDVCRHSSTPGMRAEATFRNHRRWLPLDLMCGRVDRTHPLWSWLLANGIEAAELDTFLDTPVPPTIVGGNYYVTSDRFLDERPSRQPPSRRFTGPGGPYGETESVRTSAAGYCGHRALLNELWDRYGLPVAITEVHLGCTREEQVRWLVEAWDAAQLAVADGVDVRAVTVWGAFGLFGWNELVVRTGGACEVGLFDVRGPEPRPTALARVAADLAAGREPDAPWGGPGWWRRPIRLLGRAPIDAVAGPCSLPPPEPRPERALLVVGDGALAREVARACAVRGLLVVVKGREALDVTDARSIARQLDELEPWAVFNAAGLRSPAHAERDPERTARLHTTAPRLLGAACAARGVRLLQLSSAQVFSSPGPHTESATPDPVSVLGRAQARGEAHLAAVHPDALVVRCGTLLGLDRPDDVLAAGLHALASGQRWTLPLRSSAILASELVETALDLLIDGEKGPWHVTHRPTLFRLARAAARLASLPVDRVEAAESQHPPAALLATARGCIVEHGSLRRVVPRTLRVHVPSSRPERAEVTS